MKKKSHPKCRLPRNLHPRRARLPSPPCGWQHGRRPAGCGVGWDMPGGGTGTQHLLAPSPCSSRQPLRGSALPRAPNTFNHKTRAKPVSYPLLPFASVCGGAEHPAVPLLYLRGCGCGWMDRKGGDWWSVLLLELTAGQPGDETWRGKVEGEQWNFKFNPQNEVCLLSADVENCGLPTK